MKFHVKTIDFNKAISTVESIVSTREVKSALANILIETESDSQLVYLSSTDMDISIKTSLSARIYSEGHGSIPAKQLGNIIKSINFPETSLELSKDEEENLRTLITDAQEKVDFKMTINGYEEEEPRKFPKIEEAEKKYFSSTILSQMFKKTFHAVAVEDTRYVFNGLYLSANNEEITVVATDGRRLAKIQRKINNPFSFQNGIIIPHKAVREILKLLDNTENISLLYIQGQLYVSDGKTELLCKLIDGNYPDYDAVIPKSSKHSARINKEDFTIALRQALIAAEEPSHQIRLSFSNNKLNINSSDPGSTEASISLNVDYKGDDITIAFKGDYLIDITKVIEAQEIEVRFNTPNSPAVFLDPADNQFISVIMPMKI